jgi:hypothetical protein
LREYKYLGNFAACEPWAAQGMSCDDCSVSWTGCWDNFQCPKCGNGELPNCNFPELKPDLTASKRSIHGEGEENGEGIRTKETP